MSIHRSLVIKSALARSRNVFTRMERLKMLEEDGRWSEGDSVFGLPKVKTTRKARKSKKEKKAEAAAAAEADQS